MGLFGKKKEQAELVETKKTVKEEWKSTWVNLTDKMLRVDLAEDHASAGYTIITAKDDRILLISRGVIFVEVGKRSKAYKELEPLIDSAAEEMSIETKTGDYGIYYRVRLKFKSIVITID